MKNETLDLVQNIASLMKKTSEVSVGSTNRQNIYNYLFQHSEQVSQLTDRCRRHEMYKKYYKKMKEDMKGTPSQIYKEIKTEAQEKGDVTLGVYLFLFERMHRAFNQEILFGFTIVYFPLLVKALKEDNKKK